MFCSNCGTQIPDEANFCWKCGKPQKTQTQAEEPKWETCQIETEVLKDSSVLSFVAPALSQQTLRFRVEAIGPRGRYIPYVSEPFKADEREFSKQARDVLNRLVARLTGDSWEPVETRGPRWYSYRFRRRVKS